MEQVFISLTKIELQSLIADTFFECFKHLPNQPDRSHAVANKGYVYGLQGLAQLLGCSHVTAQRIKNSGKIPFNQVGRKLVFDSDKVLAAINDKGGTK